MGNFFQIPNNIISNASTRLTNARGNPLNLPINQQPSTGIYRTILQSNNPRSVLHQITDNSENNYPSGFTPPEAYYIQGTQSISIDTGFPVEKGNLSTQVTLQNNTSIGQLTKTTLAYSPANASPLSNGNHNNSFNFTNNNSNENSKSTGAFTDPRDYIINKDNINTSVPGLTGLPKEFGDNPTNMRPNFNRNNLIYTDPDKLLNGDGVNITGAKNTFGAFNNFQQYNFLHNLDTQLTDGTGQVRGGINQTLLSNPESAANIYLGSFISTSDDNEDPTMFGYDISIKANSSPLFNGSVVSFINKFTNDIEIESRRSIWISFCNQFFKFFGIDQRSFLPYTTNTWANGSTASQNITNAGVSNFSKGSNTSPSGSYPPLSNDTSAPKSYYLKKISGLDKLVEGEISSTADTVRSMVDYGKDMIKLTMWEDVSVNMGYLSTLYKTLSWSRLRGKHIIPENLLRFDVDITITEIREYNRVINSGGTELDVYADRLSKYTYTLYDCQLKFDRLSHGDEIDMSAVKLSDDFDLGFIYKYSTLNFSKFSFNTINNGDSSTIQSQQYSIDNSKSDLLKISSSQANNTTIQSNPSGTGALSNTINPTILTMYDYWPKNSDTYTSPSSLGTTNTITQQNINEDQNVANQYSNSWGNYLSSDQSNLTQVNQANSNSSLLANLGSKLATSVVYQINKQISTQAKLLNNTIDNINNSISLTQISPPINVYYSPNQIISDVRDFVGQSVK